MFGNFTGSSRKPRKVDLSGQKRDNPFSGTAWAPGTSSGPNKSVEDASKQREERQRQRDRLRAAMHLQRVWRGYQTRGNLRQERRLAFDDLYETSAMLEPSDRVPKSLPLLMSLFHVSEPRDLDRLSWLLGDLLDTRFDCFQSGTIHKSRLSQLSRILVSALKGLESDFADPRLLLFLSSFQKILQLRPISISHFLKDFYEAIARHSCSVAISPEIQEVLRVVTTTPLVTSQATESFRTSAYSAFAWGFLTQANLVLWEDKPAEMASKIDLDQLASALLEEPARDGLDRIWLVTHFIGLHRAQVSDKITSLYLEAIYKHLSALAGRIRDGLRTQAHQEGDVLRLPLLPPFVCDTLQSLYEARELERLFDQFSQSLGYATPEKDADDAIQLARVILVLIRIQPDSSDEIRLRLYLTDLQTDQGRIPAIKFFRGILFSTTIFEAVTSSPKASVELLRQLKRGNVGSRVSRQTWIKEWQTLLLFLELYIFVLRLTDDDDFVHGLHMSSDETNSSSRIRASAFSLKETEDLSLFLRNLCYAIHWEELGPLLGSSAQSYGGDSDTETTQVVASVSNGVDYVAITKLATDAVQMLHQRDSRRRFLPEDHWLMTEMFDDLDGFMQAVLMDFRAQQQADTRDSEILDTHSDMDDSDDSEDEPLARPSSHNLQSINARVAMQRGFRRQAEEFARKSSSPRMRILRNMPFVIPFGIRVLIFRQFVHLDMARRRDGQVDADQWRNNIMARFSSAVGPRNRGREILSAHHGYIKRGQVFHDAMEAFWGLGEGLKEPIQITFVDRFDAEEAGIDGGGVTKEFLTSVINEVFAEPNGLFVPNGNNAHFPNPSAMDTLKETLLEMGIPENSQAWNTEIAKRLRQYEFLGRIIGKCIYENILIDVVFAGFFLLRWSESNDATIRASVNDLRELDEELYQGMMKLKNYGGDVKELGLDFTLDDPISAPGQPVKTKTSYLLPGGSNMAVTNKNRPLYISYVARHRLMVQAGAQTRAFLTGLSAVIDPAWLRMFNQNELQRLVGGDNTEIDVEDLRENTEYSGPYQIGDDGEEHPAVQLFWQVMHELDDKERREVLKYVTSTPRAPLQGFAQLNPPFTIRFGGSDQERLPSASTCVNLLKLPAYETAALLKKKLLYAIKAGAGFDLS